MHRRSPLLVGLVAALLWVCGSQAAVSQTLYAYFDVDGNLQFRYADSSNIGSTIPPGSYSVNLNNNTADDYAVDHKFHIFGPGIDYTPPTGAVQTTFAVTFQAGATYTIQDDLHPKDIHETILATTSGGTASTTTGTTATPTGSKTPTSSDVTGSDVIAFRGSLDAIVSASGVLSLSRSGKTVKSLRQGRYTFAVDDESKKAGFTLQSLRGKPVTVTLPAYVGSHDRTVTLKVGRWFYFTPGGKKLQFIVLA